MKALRTVSIVIVLLFFAASVFAADTGESGNNANVDQKKTKKNFLEIQSAVRETLDSLVDAYVSKNKRRFMYFVSDDYAGDETLLDRKLSGDFSKFADMDIRYTLNNVTTDSRNENISVAVTFTRSYTSVKTARRINKTGSAVFIFRMVDGRPKLRDMKRPYMFGVEK